MNDLPKDSTRKPSSEKVKSGWLKLLLFVALLSLLMGLYGMFSSAGVLAVVNEQLDRLRENKITQAYYDYTSKEFQKTTTLAQFRQFIALYKPLSENKKFIYESQHVEDGVGKVDGVLISADLHEMHVEYVLAKEDEGWKIQSISLKEVITKDNAELIKQELTDKVNQHLKVLQNKDINEAYYGFLSNEFQNETPFSDFNAYVKSNPVLTSFKNVDFKKSSIKNDIGYVDAVLTSDAGKFPIEYKLKNESGIWKVWSIHLVFSTQLAGEKIATDPDALKGPVRAFLDSLLSDKLENAYDDTAREFQEATTLGSFQRFVHSYPVLQNRDLRDIKPGMIEDGVGKLRVNLHDKMGMTVLEFKLGYEVAQWKIWGVKVIETPYENAASSQETGEFNSQSFVQKLNKVILGQLDTLRHHDLTVAYEQYSSENYKNEHSLGEFEDFLHENSVFLHNRNAKFERMEQRGSVIRFKGTISSLDFKTYPVQYDLIKENGAWKIQDFEKLNSSPPIADADLLIQPTGQIKPIEKLSPPKTEIKDVIVGDEVDTSGVIKVARSVMDSDINLLYINVSLANGVEGTLVTLFLNHVDSGTHAPPLSTTLKKDGDTVLSFSYAAPSKGWPEGNYIVKVTVGSGLEKVLDFQMRQGEKKFY